MCVHVKVLYGTCTVPIYLVRSTYEYGTVPMSIDFLKILKHTVYESKALDPDPQYAKTILIRDTLVFPALPVVLLSLCFLSISFGLS